MMGPTGKGHDMHNRQKLWASALLVAVFVAGAAGGGAATQAWGGGNDSRECRRDRPVSYADRLRLELALTPAQYETVDRILDRHQPAMHALWREVRPRLDSLRGELREQIGGVLTPEQRVKYQQHLVRLEQNRAARDRKEKPDAR